MKGDEEMKLAINDATTQQAGTIYQYLIALRDCFELDDDDVLQIEVNGDVSKKNSSGGLFQKEVKHHFIDKALSDRDVDFWKTLANWYEDYERVKGFSAFILSTTARISKSSSFYNWNFLKKKEKLERIKKIGIEIKKREKNFRKQYKRIFNDTYNEKHLIFILDRFSIESSQTSIQGISKDFTKFIGTIPNENRDAFIGALLGRILIKVKYPPYKWEVTKSEFEKILQSEATTHGKEGVIPLPTDFAREEMPEENISFFEEKKFVLAIKEIEYEKVLHRAMLDYWKANMTIARYFKDDLLYLDSLEQYIDDLTSKMFFTKENIELDAKGLPIEEQIIKSKKLYNHVMQWDAKDFGSIIRNQSFFQNGIIHCIVDTTDFRWKVGEER